MPADINYKSKYQELKLKFMNSVDIAFRLGFEAGAQQAQQQQALEAQAQTQEAELRMQEAEAAGINGQPGGGNSAEGGQSPQPGSNPAEGGQSTGELPAPGAANPAGSELDQHINKLEGMLGSNASPEVKKSLQDIIELRKAEKLAFDLKKGDEAIKGIVKALHKPAFKMNVQAKHNLTDDSKKAVTLQHKIVNDVFKSWKEEESKASKDITAILNVEGLLKE